MHPDQVLLEYRTDESPHRKIQHEQRPTGQIGIAIRQWMKQHQPVPPEFHEKLYHFAGLTITPTRTRYWKYKGAIQRQSGHHVMISIIS